MKDFDLVEKRLDGCSYISKKHKMFVISSTAKELDGNYWQHVSLSCLNKKMPTYDQMKLVKNTFIGEDKKAIFVFPKLSENVNIHNKCLHLWSCDKDVLPDFSRGTGSI